MKRIIPLITAVMMILVSCGNNDNEIPEYPVSLNDNYRTYYEIFVGAFYDSDGDGTGDINGITEKLDYLNDGNEKTTDDFGIDGIWLMPINPSPTYHKYDVTDYYGIDEDFGTMEDFENFISQCDERGIRVITDLVVNHTSSKHPWFVSAINSIITYPDGECFDTDSEHYNTYCDYYNFSKDTTGGTYYSVGNTGWNYEASFWSEMPDLKLDNPQVRQEILSIAEFWLNKGVGGFRLDAVIHYFNQNTSKNTDFLKWLYDELKIINPEVYLVGEAWTSDGTIEQLYESGIPSLFNFGFSNADGRIIKSVISSKGESLAKSFENWQNTIKSANPDAIDAVFLSNHDNGRSAGALRRDIVLEKMAAGIYLLSRGNPFIYYGEEIGMTGSGIDENKRQPLVWSVNDDTGIAKPVEGSTNTSVPEAGIEEQLKDDNSLLSYYRAAIRLRNLNPGIARGDVTAVDVGDETLCALRFDYNGETLYVIHNISEKEKSINLDKVLSESTELRGYLTANSGSVILKNNELNMPQYSTAILIKQVIDNE